MSVLGRLRRAVKAFRSEDWMSLYNYNSDQTTPLTYTSELVTGEYTDMSQWSHLLKVAREDPLAYRMTVGLAKNVFDDWFTIKKRGEDGELKDHPLNDQVQEEFVRMDAKRHFTQAATGMYIFGSAVMVFNSNVHRDDTIKGYQIATLDVFTKENMIIPDNEYDMVTGVPQRIKIYPNATNEEVTDFVRWEEVQWWCVDPVGRSFEGYSTMAPVWANLTYFRESNDAMVWSHKKEGIGTQMWYILGAASSEVVDDLEEQLQEVTSRRAMVVENDKVDRVEWTAPPSSGTASIVQGLDFALGIISAGSEIPKDIYTGVSAGAITGSEVNNKAMYAVIDKRQSEITPYVQNTIQRMGYDPVDMVIDWNVRYATDELEQAQIRLLNAQAAQLEMQVEQGIDPNAINIGFNAGEDPDQTQNPTGVQS